MKVRLAIIITLLGFLLYTHYSPKIMKKLQRGDLKVKKAQTKDKRRSDALFSSLNSNLGRIT